MSTTPERKMIDIHMHLIPGADDGAEDEQMALLMLLQAKDQGIRAVFATPHSSAFDADAEGTKEKYRQLRGQPVTWKPLPPRTWKHLFWGGVVLLVILILAAHRIAPVYIAADAAQEDSAAGYASVFFPLIIGGELVLGFLLWLLWDRLRFLRQKRKQQFPFPCIGTNGGREYE